MTPTPAQAQRLDHLAASLHALPNDRQAAALDMLDDNHEPDTRDAHATPNGPHHHAQAPNLLDTDPELATVPLAELQTRYGTNVKTLRTHIAEGKLRAIKVGKGYRVTVAAVRDWLALHEVKPNAEA